MRKEIPKTAFTFVSSILKNRKKPIGIVVFI